MVSQISSEDFYSFNKLVICGYVDVLRKTKNNMQIISNEILIDFISFNQQNRFKSDIISFLFSEFAAAITKGEISTREHFFTLIHDCEEIFRKNTPDYKTLIDTDVFIKWCGLKKKDDERNKLDSHNFNILKMFDICETMHSQLLKLLLNSNESHGQGKLFFTIFLEELGIKAPDQGQWKVTVEEGKIDILLRRNDPLSIVVIENKSNWAYDQPNQLYRYWHKTIYHATKQIELDFYNRNKDSFQIIYLTPNSNKHYSSQTTTKPADLPDNLPIKIPMEIKSLSFDEFIFEWLSKCIVRVHEENYRMKEYLKQYQEICSTL
jgi:hypothetical protein